MLEIALPFARPSHGWWTRGSDLLRYARDVESAQPHLAIELRGMALHGERVSAAPASPVADAWWRRAARSVWSAMEAYGEARARRDMLALADRWESTQPELAKELRAASLRNG